MSETQAEDTRPRAFIEAYESLDSICSEILRLELERHVVELELYGYTVSTGVKPIGFCEDLRKTILQLGAEDAASGRTWPLTGTDGGKDLMPWLLVRGRTFEEALMAEQPLALLSWLLGKSCQISSNHRRVRVEGDPPQGLHNDAPMEPDPALDHDMTCKMMWVIDEFTRESGAALVVPGSHKRRGHPDPDGHRTTMSLEAPQSSVIVFSGNLIHGVDSRTMSGEHVGMTVYFKRMSVQPQEDLNAVISDELIARNPPRFARLIGRYNSYPAKDFGFFNAKGMKYTGRTADSRGKSIQRSFGANEDAADIYFLSAHPDDHVQEREEFYPWMVFTTWGELRGSGVSILRRMSRCFTILGSARALP